MNIDRTKYLKTIDALTDALGRSDDQAIEDMLADIKNEGIDADAALARLKESRLNIAMEAKRLALDSARAKRLKLVEKGHEFIGKFNDWTRDQIMTRIKELSGPGASLAYRDLDRIGTEEMISILEDLEMAHHIAMDERENSE